jgi:predicted nucleic acid-binding protein
VAETKSGLLDTSVVIDLDVIAPNLLPEEASVSAVTMAELSAGPHATGARAFGRIYAAVLATGRQPRGRMADLLIAATAVAAGLPLYTRNADDFRGLEQILAVVAV